MDVSRIEAISPRQIDWRRLTANQIIKYQEQGVDVPSQYIQWAQDFVNSIYSDDVTTYEKAESSPSLSNKSATKNDVPSNDEGDSIDSVDSSNDNQDKELSANEYVDSLKDHGKSNFDIARELMGISKDKKNDADNSADICSSSIDSADVSIENLENYMSNLLSEADDIKSQMVELKNKKDDTGSNIQKLNKLSQQLKSLGTVGQNTLVMYGTNFDDLQSVVSGQISPINSASDYGEKTVEVGQSLSKILIYARFKDKVIKAGESAVSSAQTASDLQSQATDSLDKDINSVKSYKNEITASTGVSIASPDMISGGKTNDNGKKDSEKDSLSSNKDDKSNQYDSANMSNKQVASLDEILKKKIREGQYVDGANA